MQPFAQLQGYPMQLWVTRSHVAIALIFTEKKTLVCLNNFLLLEMFIYSARGVQIYVFRSNCSALICKL